MIYPSRLRQGDGIAIVSPASTVKEEYIDGAARLLSEAGYRPVVMPHAKGPASGSYAASEEGRTSDLLAALTDPGIKAILCARGGYGCVHLLPHIPPATVRANPKWLIGYSDVSALHALWLKSGVASIHGPMAKHLSEEGRSHHATAHLLRLLSESPEMDYRSEANPYNRTGQATGRLAGGNLAVLNGLSATEFDILGSNDDKDGRIIFVEDISEPIYAVERMLTRLWLSGALKRARGLIFGRFTEYRPDRNFKSMEEMADSFLRRAGISDIPVVFGFPTGHVADNLPLVEGAMVALTAGPDGGRLRTLNHQNMNK